MGTDSEGKDTGNFTSEDGNCTHRDTPVGTSELQGEAHRQLVVPAKYVTELFQLAHDCTFTEHLGTKRTTPPPSKKQQTNKQNNFYWPGILKDVEC